MLAIILWIISLIIWVGNLIILTKPHRKNVSGNGFNILVTVLFIILSAVNIIGGAMSLNNNTSIESKMQIETSSDDEEFIQDNYYVIDEAY